jgi:hypothetical protein
MNGEASVVDTVFFRSGSLKSQHIAIPIEFAFYHLKSRVV